VAASKTYTRKRETERATAAAKKDKKNRIRWQQI